MCSEFSWEWYRNRRNKARRESNRRRARIAAERFKRRCVTPPAWAAAWGAAAASVACAALVALAG